MILFFGLIFNLYIRYTHNSSKLSKKHTRGATYYKQSVKAENFYI